MRAGHESVSARAAMGEVGALPVEVAQTLLPADLIHDDEIIILLLRPSMWFIVLAPLASLVGILLGTLILAYMAQSPWMPWIPWTDTQVFGLGFLAALLRVAWQALDWFSRVYVLTDRRVIRRMGVLRVTIFETSLKNIQHTAVHTRLRERLFGLGSIGFATSGSDVFDAFWVMVRDPFGVHKLVIQTINRYSPKR